MYAVDCTADPVAFAAQLPIERVALMLGLMTRVPPAEPSSVRSVADIRMQNVWVSCAARSPLTVNGADAQVPLAAMFCGVAVAVQPSAVRGQMVTASAERRAEAPVAAMVAS